jgi:hypothetical protein
MNKESKIILEGDFGIDSRYKSKIDKDQDSISLLESRLARLKNMNAAQIIDAKLIQLKLQMEDFMTVQNNELHQKFVLFLKSYIDIFYVKQNDFAEDINIQPNLLSKILNHHREPNDEFIQKVMVHSEKAFKNINNYSSTIWYYLYYHERIHNSISKQNEWRPEIEKQVKLTIIG